MGPLSQPDQRLSFLWTFSLLPSSSWFSMYLPPLLLPLLSYLSSKVQTPMSAPSSTPARDIASYSTPALVQSQHLSLDWTINWSKQTISGSVQHDLVVKQGDVKKVVLDVRDLEIFGVSVDGEEIKVRLSPRTHPFLFLPSRSFAMLTILPATLLRDGPSRSDMKSWVPRSRFRWHRLLPRELTST